MTRAVKIALIVAAALVFLGVIIAGVAIAFSDRTDFYRGDDFTERTASYPADLKQIKTDLVVADLNVTRISGDKITLRYYENEYITYSITTTNGILKITRQDRNRWFFIGFDFRSYGNNVEIGIPESYDGILTLRTSTGDIKISELSMAAESSAVSTTGDTTIENCSVPGDFSVKVSTGRIKITSFNVAGNLTVETTTGDVYLSSVSTIGNLGITQTTGDLSGSEINCAGDIHISRSTGYVSINNVTAASIRAEASTGSTNITNLTTFGAIYLESSTGDIRCSVTDGISKYNITSRTSTGDNNLPKSAGYGDKQLSVFTTTGDIRFTFAE